MPRIYVSPSSQEHNVGPNGYVEEEQMNLVADILCPELTRHGIEWMRNNPANIYSGHVAESNAYMSGYTGEKYHLAIHSDAGGGHGCTSFCYDASNPNKKGTQFATSLYNQITAISPWAGRGVKSSTMDEVEKTTAPACLIEVEFHDNAEGAEWIRTHIPDIAHALLIGILNQLQIEYIPPVPPEPDYKALYEEQLAINAELQKTVNQQQQTIADQETKITDLTNKNNELLTDIHAIGGAYDAMDNGENIIVMAENTVANILDKYN